MDRLRWEKRVSRESELAVPWYVLIRGDAVIDWIRWSHNIWINYQGKTLSVVLEEAKSACEKLYL